MSPDVLNASGPALSSNYALPSMDAGRFTGFDTSSGGSRMPSPIPSFYPSNNAPFNSIPLANGQNSFGAASNGPQFPSTAVGSSVESMEGSGSHYSRPFSAAASRMVRTAAARKLFEVKLMYYIQSWSSSDLDWPRQGTVYEKPRHVLERENAELLKQTMVWKAKFETLQYVWQYYFCTHLIDNTRSAYNLLLDRVPIHTEAERPKLNHEDFKQIDYWFRHQWVSASADRIMDLPAKAENENNEEEMDMEVEGETSEDIRPISPAPGAKRGQGRSRAGINVAMHYIQDKDGNVISGHRSRDIRNHARAVFVSFATKGNLFSTWGEVDVINRRLFFNEMALCFEELKYCDLDWKAEQIAIDTFPGWKVTWLKKQKKGKGYKPEPNAAAKKRSCRLLSVEEPDKRQKDLDIPVPSTPVVFEVARCSSHRIVLSDKYFIPAPSTKCQHNPKHSYQAPQHSASMLLLPILSLSNNIQSYNREVLWCKIISLGL